MGNVEALADHKPRKKMRRARLGWDCCDDFCAQRGFSVAAVFAYFLGNVAQERVLLALGNSHCPMLTSNTTATEEPIHVFQIALIHAMPLNPTKTASPETPILLKTLNTSSNAKHINQSDWRIPSSPQVSNSCESLVEY